MTREQELIANDDLKPVERVESTLEADARELVRLSEAATPPPWWDNEHYPHEDDQDETRDGPNNCRYVESTHGNICATNAKTRDVEFIAHARNYSPALAAAYLAGQTLIRELEALVASLSERCSGQGELLGKRAEKNNS